MLQYPLIFQEVFILLASVSTLGTRKPLENLPLSSFKRQKMFNLAKELPAQKTQIYSLGSFSHAVPTIPSLQILLLSAISDRS